MRRLVIVILLSAAVVGCRDAPTSGDFELDPAPELDSDIDVEVGKRIVFRDEGFTIRFRKVVSDSRCPIGYACVWAGNAKIRVAVEPITGGLGHVFELNTYLEPKQASYAAYTIHLVALNPYPHADRVIQSEDYVATLRVTRDESAD